MVSKVVSYARIQWMGAALGLTLLAPASANAASPASTPASTSTAAPQKEGSVSSHRASSHASSHHAGTKKGALIATKHSSKKDATRVEKCDKPEKNGKPEVEMTGSKEVPRQSLTPLPTIAAAMGTPLMMPMTLHLDQTMPRAHHAVDHVPDADSKGHGREPRRTPILVSTHPASHHLSPPPKPSCMSDAIEVMRGTEEEKLTLTKCDGSVAPFAVESLSIMARPGNAAKPTAPLKELAKTSGKEIAPGIRRIDPRLVERLQSVIDHFAKAGSTPKVFVVSGVRPSSAGSFHANGRALDFRIDGVKNEDLVAFCKTVPDTGCGFYPNSSFIHIDVRDAGTGHVSWIDASTPGETPKYVAVWPPPKSDDDTDLSVDPVHLLSKLDSELQLLPPPVGPDTGSKPDPAGHDHDDVPAAKVDDHEKP